MNPLWRRVAILLLCASAAYVAVLAGSVAYVERDEKIRNLGAYNAICRIHDTELRYRQRFGRYANSFAELGEPARSAVASAGGYQFALTGGDDSYRVVAMPSGFLLRGTLAWYSDQSMDIRYRRVGD